MFDVKINCARKARSLLDKHRQPSPEGSNYSGLVSRESVRLAFTYVFLNDADVWACEIQNTCLQAPTTEKHHIICGQEFSLKNVGKIAVIHRATYGRKTRRPQMASKLDAVRDGK